MKRQLLSVSVLCVATICFCISSPMLCIAGVAEDYARGKSFCSEGNWNEALSVFKNLADGSSDKDIARVAEREIPICYDNLKDLSSAVVACEKYMSSYPNDEVDSWQYRTGCYLSALGRHGEALSMFKKIVDGSSNKDLIRVAERMISICYVNLNDLSSAVAACKQYMSSYPDDEVGSVGYSAGCCLKSLGKYDEALSMFKKVVDGSSNKDIACIAEKEIPVCYENLNDLSSAVAAYEKYINSYPDDNVDSLQYSAGCNLKVLGRYNDAISMFRRAVGSSTNNELIRLAKKEIITCHESLSDWTGTVAACEDYINSYPDDNVDSLQYHTGCCLKSLGKYDEALSMFKKVVDGSSDKGIARSAEKEIPLCYENLNDLSSAVAAYEKYINEYPNDEIGSLQYSAGCCLKSLRKYDEALSMFKKVVDGSSNKDMIWNAKRESADCYGLSGDWAKYISENEALLKEYPEQAASLLLWIGRGYHVQGNQTEAIATLKKGLEAVGPNDKELKAGIMFFIGASSMRNKDFDTALSIYQTLTRDYPENKETPILMCESLCGQGKQAEALAFLDKLYDDRSDLRYYTLIWKSEVLLQMQNPDGAVNLLNQFISEYPGNEKEGVAKSLLAIALEGCGRVDEAVEMWKLSLPKNATADEKAANQERIANAYFEAKRFNDAIGVYGQLRDCAALSDESRARTMYTLGYCYHEVGNKSAAESSLRMVTDQYPNSDAARDARMMLESWSVNN